MKKNGILLVAVILLSTVGLVQAQEGELHGTFDITYLNNYIWRGFDIYEDDHSAIQPSIDLDLYGTGFGVNILMSRANGSGYENAEELDVTLHYSNSLFESETYATDYKVGWVYYTFPDEPRSGSTTGQAADMQELFAALSLPEICPAGIVPSYTIVCMWPSEGGSSVSENGGWAHIFGLGYDLTVAGLVPDIPEQVLHLSLEFVYNDGVAPGPVTTGANVDHDWSHAVLGVSTDFDLGNNLTFTPSAYYQASMDDSVNDEDETWLSLSMKYKF